MEHGRPTRYLPTSVGEYVGNTERSGAFAQVTYKALLEAFADCKDAKRAAWILDEMREMQVNPGPTCLLVVHGVWKSASKSFLRKRAENQLSPAGPSAHTLVSSPGRLFGVLSCASWWCGWLGRQGSSLTVLLKCCQTCIPSVSVVSCPAQLVFSCPFEPQLSCPLDLSKRRCWPGCCGLCAPKARSAGATSDDGLFT